MNICNFCGKWNKSSNLMCSNCYYDKLFSLKEDFGFESIECHVCFENYNINLHKRYYSCGHALCDKCSVKIDICPICRSGELINVEHPGYFNIIPRHLMEKCKSLRHLMEKCKSMQHLQHKFSHKNILIYLEWVYASNHVDANIHGIPCNEYFMEIWDLDLSNFHKLSSNEKTSGKQLIFCKNDIGFKTRFYETFQTYLVLFGNGGLIKDDIGMPFFRCNSEKYHINVYDVSRTFNFKIPYSVGETVEEIKHKISDLSIYSFSKLQLCFEGKILSDFNKFTKDYNNRQFFYILNLRGD